LRPADVLMLDEPTNDLDIPTLEVLEESLLEFAGAVVLVTHDLRLIELTMDTLWLVADGTVATFEGDVDDYRRLVLAQRAPVSERRAEPGVANGRERRRATAERRAQLAPLRSKAREAEKAMAKLEAEREWLEATLADPALYADAAEAARLARKRGELAAAIAQAETRWLAAAEALEAAEKEDA